MFAKLNRKIFISEYPKGELYISYGDHSRIRYYKTIRSSEALSIIPERYRSKFLLLLVEITNNIPAHTDSGITCNINFYIDSGNYQTNFWKVLDGDQTYQVANQTNGKVFKPDAVELVDSFFAQAGDVYLLDVTKPHSVECDTPGLKRVALSLQTASFTFDEVKEMLKETGYMD